MFLLSAMLYLAQSIHALLQTHFNVKAAALQGSSEEKKTVHALPIPPHLPIKKPILIPCPHLLLLRHLFLPPF